MQAYVTAANSIALLHGIGVDTLRRHNLNLTQQLIDAVDSDKLVTPPAAAQRGGTVVLNYPGAYLEPLSARLREAGIGFDVRPTGIRLSPHIYNTAEEISQLVELL